MLGARDSCHEHVVHSMNDLKIRKENWDLMYRRKRSFGS